MGKIICDVCGTSFSDNSVQCPICGYVNPAMAGSGLQDNGEIAEQKEYQFTKGGRFSKANVRKRLKEHPIEDVDEYSTPDEYETEEKRNDGPLIIIAVLLLLAVAAIVLFITMRYFKDAEKPVGLSTTVGQTTEVEDTTVDVQTEDTTPATEVTEVEDGIPCEKIVINGVEDGQVVIPEGSTYVIAVTVEPGDTTDEIKYESQNPEIATVEDGVVTPVKTGSATIVITCGDVSTELSVSCTVPETLMLDATEFELTYEGDTFPLYTGSIPVEEIIFSSDDALIVTIDTQGVITAVAEGETTVRATYGDTEVTCKIICKFEEESTENPDNITEDGGNTEGTETTETLTSPPKATGTKGYKIRTFGNVYPMPNNPAMFDTTTYVGSSITLRLRDSYGNLVDATWKVYNTDICKVQKEGGDVYDCLAVGTAYVVATTPDGETYVCIVRVEPYPGKA